MHHSSLCTSQNLSMRVTTQELAGQIQSYMFEPGRTVQVVAENEDEAMAAEQDNDNRLGNLHW